MVAACKLFIDGNDTAYGLARGAWTQNLSRAMRIRKMWAGDAWVNTYRRVSGLLEFTVSKNVMIDFSDEKRDAFAIKT